MSNNVIVVAQTQSLIVYERGRTGCVLAWHSKISFGVDDQSLRESGRCRRSRSHRTSDVRLVGLHHAVVETETGSFISGMGRTTSGQNPNPMSIRGRRTLLEQWKLPRCETWRRSIRSPAKRADGSRFAAIRKPQTRLRQEGSKRKSITLPVKTCRARCEREGGARQKRAFRHRLCPLVGTLQ